MLLIFCKKGKDFRLLFQQMLNHFSGRSQVEPVVELVVEPAIEMDLKNFSQNWIAAWNSHDMDKILSFYDKDIVFRSKTAVKIVGKGK